MAYRNVRTVDVMPVLAWILIQLAALGLGASGLPLWAHHPLPRESIAVDEMVAIQIAATAMLFPVFLVNAQTTVVIAALLWPFLHLAGILSGTPEVALLLACTSISVWIAGLGSCKAGLNSPAATMLGVCLAQTFSIGGVLLWYLFQESRGGGSAPAELFGPLVGAIRLINQSDRIWMVLGESALPLLIGLGNALRISLKKSARH